MSAVRNIEICAMIARSGSRDSAPGVRFDEVGTPCASERTSTRPPSRQPSARHAGKPVRLEPPAPHHRHPNAQDDNTDTTLERLFVEAGIDALLHFLEQQDLEGSGDLRLSPVPTMPTVNFALQGTQRAPVAEKRVSKSAQTFESPRTRMIELGPIPLLVLRQPASRRRGNGHRRRKTRLRQVTTSNAGVATPTFATTSFARSFRRHTAKHQRVRERIRNAENIEQRRT